ncbi:unnamed protein product [Rhizophagus irregularis]|nr:unnamed protein product [Rhizophagus irregularis]
MYSAIWKDGPLYKKNEQSNYTRNSNKKVALKCLHNSQGSIESLINETKKYPTKYKAFQILYGISQNPNTGNYILVQNNYIWTSGNEKIDDFIQKKQLKINNYDDIILEWIPYNQFNEIKNISKNDLIAVYSAIWMDGPLDYQYGEYTRDSNKEVTLKCLCNSKESIGSLINEAEKYLSKYKEFQVLYGISQDTDTEDYILVYSYTINMANWIIGNEKIDDFIQKRQLKLINYDVVLEWIPYNQFNEIKEIGKNGLVTIYSAIWKDGPLYKKNEQGNYKRNSNRNVILKCLYNSQESIESLINEAKKCSTKHEAFQVLYGISQNPDTEDYILVQNNYIWSCGNEKIDEFIQERQLKIHNSIWKDGPLYKKDKQSNYTRDSNKKAKKYSTKFKAFQALYGISQNPDTGNYILVQNNNIWTCENKKIDDFIQKRQLKINNYKDIVLEWIPYNQFNEIKEIGKNNLITVYTAIWKDGPLYKKDEQSSYIRNSNEKVALKCLHNSQESVGFLINESKKYPTKYNAFQVLYGISRDPDTGDYILVQNNSINLANCISGNEKIDDFILERQLKINNYKDIKDGPLYRTSRGDHFYYTREPNKKISFKCLHNSQESIQSLINEAKKYPIDCDAFQVLYGISQTPDTGDYILIQSHAINMINWISGNKKIDDFIQERQLKINNYKDIVLEWIPYNQFNKIKNTGKNDLVTVYSAIWKDGPLYKKYSWDKDYYTRDSNKKVALKCLHNSQESIDYLINEVKRYPTKHHEAFQVLYGMSQNPDTGDYILVLIWTSGNEKIDNFIRKEQLKINDYDNIMLEWIPYKKFNKIKEISKNGLITIYSAIWKDGPLYKKYSNWSNYKRNSNKKVFLKCLHNLQESIDFLINEAKKYPTKYEAFQVLYGISQNPDTGDYILVQNNYTWISENKKIDDFIQKKQSKINNYGDIVLEWIPYNQFKKIKNIGKNGIYSAIWKDGPLYKKNSFAKNYTRNSNKKVTLKCLHILQESIESLINEAERYPTKHEAFQVLYGISQNPDTGDYILVQNNYPWTSGNERIDDFIKERQLKINNYDDIVLEWIPYNQFNKIEKLGKNSLITVYSAVWKDGPLYKKNSLIKNYTRDANKRVGLKCLHNSQEFIDSLINEAKKCLTKYISFQALYGISQNPYTGNYILVQNNYTRISGNERIDNLIQEMQLKINNHGDLVFEWIPYNQFNNIKEVGKGGFAIVYSANWKNGPLEYDVDKKYIKGIQIKKLQ